MEQARANIYRFFSTIFLDPPDEHLISTVFPYVSSALQELLGVHFSLLENVAEIREDYTNLFVLTTNKYLKPYESVYLDEGLVRGLSTIRVQNAYSAAGVKPVLSDLPDHMGLELDFMAYLCEEKEQNLDLQKQFLDNHIRLWVNDFCARLAEKSDTSFYREISSALRLFIEYDYNLIRELQRAETIIA